MLTFYSQKSLCNSFSKLTTLELWVDTIFNLQLGGIAAYSHFLYFPQHAIISLGTQVKVKVAVMEIRRVRPDSKGRIPLGQLANGVSSFSIITDGDRIILQPYSEIPTSEKWIFDNKPALISLKKGLSQAKSGDIQSRGSFSQYADEDIE